MDLDVVERMLGERLAGRYPGAPAGIEIGRGYVDNRICISVWPTAGGIFYNQWVMVKPDGEVEFPAPDDGCTPIGSKPWWVYHLETDGQLVDKAVELVDAAVEKVRTIVSQQHRSLVADIAQPATAPDRLAEACRTWQAGRDQGSSLIRAGARVLVGRVHYFQSDFIATLERDARANPAALGRAATLLQAVNASRPLSAEQWSREVGSPVTGFAGRGLAAKPAEDEQILRALKTGRITMPLWGVSLDPEIARSYGGLVAPRWIFEIVGEFRAVPAWVHSGIKAEEHELICGGQYLVRSMVEEGPTTRVCLEYVARCGDKVGSDSSMLRMMGRIPDILSSSLERIGLPGEDRYQEQLNLALTGDREFEATLMGSDSESIRTRYRPNGWFDGENTYYLDWSFPDGDGFTTVTLPADAELIAEHVRKRSDPAWLRSRKALIQQFLACVSAPGEPWESTGSFDLPSGGYVQWTRVEGRGTPVHVEINEGTFDSPMRSELVDRLVMIGWRAPDETFRNCWLRVEPHRGDEPYACAADRVILAATVVFGLEPGDSACMVDNS
jgi:hypothetical protein